MSKEFNSECRTVRDDSMMIVIKLIMFIHIRTEFSDF